MGNVLKSLIKKIHCYHDPIKYWGKCGLESGKNCNIAPSADLGSEPFLISLGNNVRITNKVRFITHDGAAANVICNMYNLHEIELFKRIRIGDNVFIGNCATIMPGVTIGNNVIVGYGAIVTKDIPSNEVWAGIPAKKICSVEEYYEKNKKYFVSTKNMKDKEKKEYLMDNIK